jgi:hypothetical protein
MHSAALTHGGGALGSTPRRYRVLDRVFGVSASVS